LLVNYTKWIYRLPEETVNIVDAVRERGRAIALSIPKPPEGTIKEEPY
jgi:hypothetical protein